MTNYSIVTPVKRKYRPDRDIRTEDRRRHSRERQLERQSPPRTKEGGWEEGQEGAYGKGAEVGVEAEGTSEYTSCQCMAIMPLKFTIDASRLPIMKT
jgi:hypothetical protein